MLVEDFGSFFQESEFAQAGELRTAGGALVRPVLLILTTPTQDIELFDSAVETALPYVHLPSAALDGITHQHRVSISGVTYRICSIRHDGTGVAMVQIKAL